MEKLLARVSALAVAAVLAFAPSAQAQSKQLTLCWAAWDPANALVELSKDFTAKTGIGMKFEFVPWTSFADRFLNELNSKGKLCDLLIGDSQWIGGAAENGHYVKLNEFFEKNGIKMSDFMPATVLGYSEWPKAAEDAGRAEGDRPVLPGPANRREEGLRRVHLYRTRVGRHHHGRHQRALRLGIRVRGPEAPVQDARLRQLARRGQGARVLQVALRLLHGARHDQRLHAGRPGRLQVGAGGDADELLRLLAGALQGSQRGRRQDRLLRKPRREEALHAARRSGDLGGLVLAQPRGRAAVHQVVRHA